MTSHNTNTIALQANAATVGNDGLTDAERVMEARAAERLHARSERSVKLVEAWRERKRAA